VGRRPHPIDRGHLRRDPVRPCRTRRLKPETPAPPVAETEGRLATLKTERERLGAVNLRAEEEGAELGAKRDGIARERDDLQEAIKRLRGAIGGLNREGRERLSPPSRPWTAISGGCSRPCSAAARPI
jgi:chromosome segregation protein